MNWTKIIFLAMSLFLGGFMVYGGYQKFAKPLPSPTSMIETYEKDGAEKMKQDPNLVIKNYIFGMKQTGFFWQFLGVCELLLGLMLISQYLRFAGAVMLVPITLQIFLFHVFLKPDDLADLGKTGLLLLVNLALIGIEYPKWKGLLLTKP